MPFLLYGLSIFIISGVSDFLLASATETYWVIAKLILPLTLGTALVRIIFNQMTFGSYGNLKKILQDTVKFLILIAFTPMIFSHSIKFTDTIANKVTESISQKNYKSIEEVQTEYKSKKNEDPQTLKSYGLFLTTNFAELFRLIVNGVTNFISFALNYLRNLSILVLFAAAPVFLYLGVMLGLEFFSKIVLSLGASLLIWPILSAILSRFSNTVFQADADNISTSFAQCSLLLMFSFFQLAIPLLALSSAFRATDQIGQGVKNGYKSAQGAYDKYFASREKKQNSTEKKA